MLDRNTTNEYKDTNDVKNKNIPIPIQLSLVAFNIEARTWDSIISRLCRSAKIQRRQQANRAVEVVIDSTERQTLIVGVRDSFIAFRFIIRV